MAIFLFLGASKFQVEFYLIAVTKSRFVFCPRRPSGRKKLMNVCTSQVPSAISNPCLLLYSSSGYQIFKHGFPISKHVCACRHVKTGPAPKVYVGSFISSEYGSMTTKTKTILKQNILVKVTPKYTCIIVYLSVVYRCRLLNCVTVQSSFAFEDRPYSKYAATMHQELTKAVLDSHFSKSQSLRQFQSASGNEWLRV